MGIATAASITWVDIGNPGNGADSNGYGKVDYEYRISQDLVTVKQYADFLNAVAATDTYSLYNTNMGSAGTALGTLITRDGTSGNYTYTVASGRDNLPIVYVSWFDAARFVNWLQSGDTETGAYDLNGATSGVGFTVQENATMWIPTEDEWYKAAYYDPEKNDGAGGYWSYATRSDTLAGNEAGIAHSANFRDSVGYTGENGDRLTEVGAYGENSQSAYGTNDQTGNIWEWNDAVINDDSRGLRGGSWSNGPDTTNLSSSFRHKQTPGTETNTTGGIRIASIPEPTMPVLSALLAGMLMLRRKR